MPANGLIIMPPTSIAYSGTSAAINTDKSVTFSAVTSLSLNGVFTSTYDNYMVTIRYTTSASSTDINARLRLAGTDASGANDYVSQYLTADSTTIGAGRITAFTNAWLGQSYATQRCGITAYLFGPALAQATAMRSVTASDNASARLIDIVGTHDLTTAYDGLTVYPSTGNMTGLLTVFGFNN